MTSHNRAGASPGLLLHAAINNNDFLECKRLLVEHGAKASTVKNRNGSTPLMLAANGKCGRDNPRLVEALLVDGSGGCDTAAEKNKKGKTAADIAFARGATALGNRLRALELDAAVQEDFNRCCICRAKLRRRSKLEFVHDKVSRGEENNRLVVEFFEDNGAAKALARPEFHRINSCISFRKELSESMALISELRQLRKFRSMGLCKENIKINGVIDQGCRSWKDWHIIDLCCGNSLTAALALHLLSGVNVTAVDMVDQKNQPHFEAAGFIRPRFEYVQSDIMNSKDLVDTLRRRTSELTSCDANTSVTTVVFGMHCCGDLSLRVIEIFHEMQADIIFLMPCCLPNKSLSVETTIESVFETNDQSEQYLRWANLLQQTLNHGGDKLSLDRQGVETSLKQIIDVLSPRNALITCVRGVDNT